MRKERWKRRKIAESLLPSPTATRGIPTTAYRRNGKFPIIDQGRSAVAGWTDDESSVVRSPLPVIVFGDHTRAFKYVDKPFARGADGTQLLVPATDLDPRFFYFACLSLDIPSRGYNRHFSVLKELEIPIPELEEQRRIASILSLAEQTAATASTLQGQLAALRQRSLRVAMTEGVRGEALKETEIGAMPDSWSIERLDKLVAIASGGTPPKGDRGLWAGDVPWVSGKDLKTSRIVDVPDKITLDAANAYSRIAPRQSVLVLVRGMGLAKGFPLAMIERPMAFNQDLKALVPGPRVSGEYLMYALSAASERMRERLSDAAHGTKRLGQDDIESFCIGVPERAEQDDIVRILSGIDDKIAHQTRTMEAIDWLFGRLLRDLMNGDLSVGDLDMAAITTAEAA